MPIRLKRSPKLQTARLQYVSWIGNTTAIAIVAANDIYIRQSPSDEEDHRLTFTGEENTIYNGVPDWLYEGQYARDSAVIFPLLDHVHTFMLHNCPHRFLLFFPEEIFTSFEAMWFSPDGNHIMYATFNDSRVGQMTYPWFTTTTTLSAGRDDNRTLFPISKQMRYPTPGSINPEVTLWVVDIRNLSNIITSELSRPAALEEQ